MAKNSIIIPKKLAGWGTDSVKLVHQKMTCQKMVIIIIVNNHPCHNTNFVFAFYNSRWNDDLIFLGKHSLTWRSWSWWCWYWWWWRWIRWRSWRWRRWRGFWRGGDLHQLKFDWKAKLWEFRANWRVLEGHLQKVKTN